MPPDIEDLPEPQGIDKKNQSDDEFREILNKNNTKIQKIQIQLK